MMMSWIIDTWFVLTGDVLTGVVNDVVSSTWNVSNLLGSPMVFRKWLWWIIKNVLLWCFNYWYVPCIIIVVYILFLVWYNYLWSFLLGKLQKKDG